MQYIATFLLCTFCILGAWIFSLLAKNDTLEAKNIALEAELSKLKLDKDKLKPIIEYRDKKIEIIKKIPIKDSNCEEKLSTINAIIDNF